MCLQSGVLAINSMINKWFDTVQQRLLLSIFLLCLFLGGLTTSMSLYITEKNRLESTQTLHRTLARTILDQYILMDKRHLLNLEKTSKLFNDLMILGPNFEFYLLNRDGDIIAHSIKGDLKSTRVSLKPIKEFISGDANFPLYGDNPLNDSSKAIFSAASINSYIESGYLYIVIGSQMQSDILQGLQPESFRQHLGLMIFVVTAFVASLYLILTQLVTRPLNKLAQTIQMNPIEEAINEGQEEKDFHGTPRPVMPHEWSPDSENEFHQLGFALETAYSKLASQYDQLAENEHMRKALLAHLSHDLRTPMASLLGYLETYLIHDEHLDREDKRSYISTALKNAQKANKLIEQLFELAHLDQKNIQMQFEQFPVAEIMQDVCAHFQVKAAEKNIDLQVRMNKPEDSRLHVYGDIEKIDRVFQNLIENAIRHTPRDGKITLYLRSLKEHAFICVKDSGIGISEKDLPYIFDSHFKAENSVRENTAHGGLGLAITKKLLHLHDSEIHVRSNLNIGTAFYFTLKKSKVTVERMPVDLSKIQV